MRTTWRLFLALLMPLPLVAADLSLVRVWSGPRAASSFERISEYFTGEENTGRETIVRSQPSVRDGYYWLVRTRSAASQAVTLEISVVAPGTSTPKVTSFPTTVPAGSHATLAGLTGADWPDPSARPVAWRVRILDASGRELVSEQSFMWAASTSP